MITEYKCPICNRESNKFFRASVSPFVRLRMFNGLSPKKCLLLYCASCDFYFFNIRPDEREIQEFYKDYRGKFYQQQRQYFETWYSSELNEMIGSCSVELRNRIAILEDMLSRHNIDRNISVLDYGGNEGKLIPDSIVGNKYCYDLSGKTTVDAVVNLNFDNLYEYEYDLVLLENVLEHIPYPRNFLQDSIVKLMRTGTYLYIETPYEIENVFSLIKMSGTHFNRVKDILKQYRPTWFLPHIPYGSGPTLHEHINYFTGSSLKALMAVAGLQVMDMSIHNMDLGWTQADILCCLARK